MKSDAKRASEKEFTFRAATTEFRLRIEDCLTGMKKLKAKGIDVVVTSPPYNLGIKYSNYTDRKASGDYLRWSMKWTAEVHRVLKDEGSFFLNLGACPSNPLLPHELVVEAQKKFTLQNTFHWIKSISIQTRDGQLISAGHFKPLHSPRYVNDCHEYVFHLTKSGSTRLDRLAIGVPYSDKSNVARWRHTKGKDLRCRGNNWFIPYRTIVNRSKERPHPATFPVELAVNCIKIHGCRPDLVVMDPFLGIGHSALAAKQCSVGRFVGFDIDPEYVAVTRKALTLGVTAPTPELIRRSSKGRKPFDTKQNLLFDPNELG